MVPAIIFDKIREMRFVFMSIKNFFIGSTDKKNARSEPKFKGYTVQFNIPITAKAIEDIFTDCYDFEARKVIIGGENGKTADMYYIDGLTSGATIAEEILRPLTCDERFDPGLSEEKAAELIIDGVAYAYTVKKRTAMDDVVSDLLNGFCAIVLEKEKKALTFEVKSQDKRSISSPTEEKVVKGSKDAFIEVMKTNSMLVRRKLRDPKLKIKEVVIGDKTQTRVGIVYIKDFTNEELVNEVLTRIKNIDCEGVLTSAVLEEHVADQPKTPFPQLLNTERPDKFCLNILEGRVGILVDGLPMGFLAPGTFSQFFKVPEDHANHFIIASMLTILRYTAMVVTLLLPAFYVAVAMYHQEMLPIKLMQSIIDAKQSVPFPTAFEVIMMLIAFELLQEAGLRLPNTIGETVSIIGALIVGQSAVEAKVVSPVVVIVIALAGIAGYTVPNQDMGAALRICRFLLVIVSIAFGMFGLTVGAVLVVYHLCTLESYGVPYMSPFAGTRGRHVSRAFLRWPMTKIKISETELKTSADPE